MFCQNCGAQSDDGSVFCPNCGARLYKESAPAQASVQPSPAQPAAVPRHAQYSQPYMQQTVQNTQARATQPSPAAKSNGPAVTALIFGAVTFVLMILSYLLTAGGVYGLAAVFMYAAMITFILNIIFGIIGFVKGLKRKAKLPIAIIGFALVFVNAVVIMIFASAIGNML